MIFYRFLALLVVNDDTALKFLFSNVSEQRSVLFRRKLYGIQLKKTQSLIERIMLK